MALSSVHIIATELGISPAQVTATVALLDEGGTVPFISRYRKEATGSLDEVAVMAIRDRRLQLDELEKRRAAILKSLTEQELITAELQQRIHATSTLTALEDIYLPYRPKRKTRAENARQLGLEPLAQWLLTEAALPQERCSGQDPVIFAARFTDPTGTVATSAQALDGARDIIAESVNENQTARDAIRRLFHTEGLVESHLMRGKEEVGAKFRDYFAFREPANRIAGHRILAIRRGEKEKVLVMKIAPDQDKALAILLPRWVKNHSPAAQQVTQAVTDGYRRLLSLAIETELRLELKHKADAEAITVFADNLRELLLAPPLGNKGVLALDPGFRTGCKLVVLDPQGDLLHHDTIYPHSGANRAAEAAAKLTALWRKFPLAAIAIGNGTAGRETETFVRKLDLPPATAVVMVNESGASIYSAGDVARREFPDLDLTVRGAVSIGRRLQDPLAELVKLDPKSIGVGQYQHDVDQKALRQSLDDTVASCVNAVGVHVNTASCELLAHVSGLGPRLASSIVAYRAENGPFKSRAQLKKVPRLGPRAFQQAAGFLRIGDGSNPLDGSAVHPESYGVVKAMAAALGLPVRDLVGNEAAVASLTLSDFVGEEVGLPTLEDIATELCKPGRDPRSGFETFAFAENVAKVEDLVPGMNLPGIVTNVTNFGAFIDVGVHQDGLAHISQLADRFIRDPAEVVKVGQRVMARVLEIDLQRQRISLSLKKS